ncbi:SGNH/GDSL hydrolase family protein [Niveibacterium sp. SC-1]|uniref:SGNH/GDSL hydrolase family protein n=1 Tax=Niveibacterium sp. SC-1 TaxID=3135646 RepID=UPI00311E43ED
MRRLVLKACGLSLLPSASMSFASTPLHAYADPRLQLIGRFQRETGDSVRFAWSGSALAFAFSGTRVTLFIADSGENRFLLDIDGKQRVLTPGGDPRRITLAEGLAPGEHRLRLTRLTEALLGETVFIGAPEHDGELLPATPRQRRLLVIGDSITAGYGAEGDNPDCGFSPATENQQLSYAALAAEALDADLHSIAWSGKGAYRNYGETLPQAPNMSALHRRTLPGRADSQWPDADYRPDAIVINLGSNDFWSGAPAGERYDAAMGALVDTLRQIHPDSPIYLMASPLLLGATRGAQVRALDRVCSARDKVRLLDLERVRPEEGWGCDYHPGRATHARQATELASRLRTDLGWR